LKVKKPDPKSVKEGAVGRERPWACIYKALRLKGRHPDPYQGMNEPHGARYC
jgi:hypothetical protein